MAKWFQSEYAEAILKRICWGVLSRDENGTPNALHIDAEATEKKINDEVRGQNDRPLKEVGCVEDIFAALESVYRKHLGGMVPPGDLEIKEADIIIKGSAIDALQCVTKFRIGESIAA
jgi:hypothetical protein